MIKRFQKISEIMNYMLEKHKFIRQQNEGGYGLVLLRKPDGRRIIVQEMRKFRIFKFDIIEPSILLLSNIITGLSFKYRKIQSASSTLYLNDLVQINVYDNSTHFISRAGIDFAYLAEDQSAIIQALQEFLHNETGGVRASWTDPNASEDELLDAMSFGLRVTANEQYRRNIAIDCGEI